MACSGLHPLPGLDQVTNPVSVLALGCNSWNSHISLSEIPNVALSNGFLSSGDKTHSFSGGSTEVYQDPFQKIVLSNVFGERKISISGSGSNTVIASSFKASRPNLSKITFCTGQKTFVHASFCFG